MALPGFQDSAHLGCMVPEPRTWKKSFSRCFPGREFQTNQDRHGSIHGGGIRSGRRPLPGNQRHVADGLLRHQPPAATPGLKVLITNELIRLGERIWMQSQIRSVASYRERMSRGRQMMYYRDVLVCSKRRATLPLLGRTPSHLAAPILPG